MTYKEYKRNLSHLKHLIKKDTYRGIFGKYSVPESKDWNAIWDNSEEHVVVAYNQAKRLVRVRRDSIYADALRVPEYTVVKSDSIDEYANARPVDLPITITYKALVVEGAEKLNKAKIGEDVEIDLGENIEWREVVINDIFEDVTPLSKRAQFNSLLGSDDVNAKNASGDYKRRFTVRFTE